MTVTLSRWGESDEKGAYNFVDNAATLRGLAAVREGRVLSLAVTIKGGSHGPSVPSRPAAQHFMLRDGGDYCGGLPERHGFGFSDDVLTIATHGTTHVDALSHVWQEGRMYNGFKASDVSSRGARRCGIDKLGPIVTRAIVVDMAPRNGEAEEGPIHVGALLKAVGQGGVDPEPGDALLVRTGWVSRFTEGRATHLESRGLHQDCADWIIDKKFAIVASDNVAVEVLPSGDPACAVPIHIRLLRDQGVYLAELLALDELAKSRRAACLFILAPLRIEGGVGSPVNPVAVL